MPLKNALYRSLQEGGIFMKEYKKPSIRKVSIRVAAEEA